MQVVGNMNADAEGSKANCRTFAMAVEYCSRFYFSLRYPTIVEVIGNGSPGKILYKNVNS